jgi:hypothetical protein
MREALIGDIQAEQRECAEQDEVEHGFSPRLRRGPRRVRIPDGWNPAAIGAA